MGISAASTTLTSIAAHYNQLFPQGRLDQLSDMETDLLRYLPKADDLYEEGMWVKMRYGRGQGFGSKFLQAQGNTSSAKIKKAFIERKRYHGSVSLDDEAVIASSKGGGSGNVKEADVEDMIKGLSQELEMHLWRDGSGSKGRILTITSATPSVITLENPDDAANFSIDEFLEARLGATDRGGDEKIVSIDPDAGTLTMSTNLVADHSWAVGDSLVRGSLSAGSDYNEVVNGFGAWIPKIAETSGTFLMMNRTDDIIRLQGFRQAYLGSIEETIKRQRARMGKYSARPDSIWLSDINWHRLEVELGSRAIREDGTAATFGLSTLTFSSPKGNMKVYSGALAEEDAGYMIKRDTWMIHHMGGLPHINPRTVTGQDYDGIEIRGRYWAELACDSLKDNGRFDVS